MIVNVEYDKTAVDENPEEMWKEMVGYEGIYQISNMGNIRRVRVKEVEGVTITKVKFLKKQIYNGYYGVMLYGGKKSKAKFHLVHRLVLETFCGKPDRCSEKMVVNHMDENKLNNRVENLEWSTHRYNCNYGTAQIRKSKTIKMPISQYSKNKRLIKHWDSATDAARELNYDQSYISKCCKGLLKTAYGFIWKYRQTKEVSR